MQTPRILKTLLVDDEELARRLVREYLKCHTDIEIICECENGMQAVEAITQHQPDLVFLDIQMPKLTGFEVLEATQRQHGVIFTTAYDQYALKAFDQHAIDYLLKPFSQQRFNDALNKARKLLDQTDPAIHAVVAQQAQKNDRILIRDRGLTLAIPFTDIDYIEAQDDYVHIHYGGKRIMKTQSLSEFEKLLPSEQFVRIHRSVSVRVAAIKQLERASKDSFQAVLHCAAVVPVSRSGYDRIKLML